MTRTISFNELRRVKHSLPSGSINRIASTLNLEEDTVRNYFGAHDYNHGNSVGFHLEPGPDGGVVILDDTSILDLAYKIIDTEIKH